jgi:NAD(P)-dependent dehydrogenase (short-subunit alcohol dehydrogenase family)
MTGLLEQYIAVVTGGGSGIGRAIAVGYAREGAQVVVLDADADTAAATAKAITGAGGKAWSLRLDVTERDKCREVAAQIDATIGQASILVNNAGINRRNAFTADPEAVIKDWEDIMAVNLNGMFNVTHAFLAQLRATRGRIVNIASIQSFVHVRTPSHRSRAHRDAAQREGARQQSRAGEDLPGSHAAGPRRKARGHRRPRDLPRLRPLGLRHRCYRHG